MTSLEKVEFQKHCDRLSIAGLYVVGITTSVGALIPWFTDFLLFEPSSHLLRTMFIFRSSILLLTLLALTALRFSRVVATNPYYLGLAAFSIMMATTGKLVAGLGGFDSAIAYGVYTTPMLSVMLFVPPVKRIIAAGAILVSYFSTLFLFAPDQLALDTVGTPITWSIASAFAAFAAGHAIYLVLRTNFLQRRKLNDLTENLQEKVAEQTGKIRQLTTAVFKVQEQERVRIAHDLHDELGQMLVRLDMEVQLMHRKEKKSTTGSFSESLSTLHSLVDQVHDSLDRVLGALKPITLEKQSFDIAVSNMVHELTKGHGLKPEVLFEADVDYFSDTAKTTLYRIVQEGTTNIVKHADATAAVVTFKEEGETLLLQILDDGKGFDLEEVSMKNRLGLKGITERAKLMGGKMTIQSGQEKGTQITIRFPLGRLEQKDNQ